MKKIKLALLFTISFCLCTLFTYTIKADTYLPYTRSENVYLYDSNSVIDDNTSDFLTKINKYYISKNSSNRVLLFTISSNLRTDNGSLNNYADELFTKYKLNYNDELILYNINSQQAVISTGDNISKNFTDSIKNNILSTYNVKSSQNSVLNKNMLKILENIDDINRYYIFNEKIDSVSQIDAAQKQSAKNESAGYKYFFIVIGSVFFIMTIVLHNVFNSEKVNYRKLKRNVYKSKTSTLIIKAYDLESNIYKKDFKVRRDGYYHPLFHISKDDSLIYSAFPWELSSKINLELCQYLSPSLSKIEWSIKIMEKDLTLSNMTFQNMLDFKFYDLRPLEKLKQAIVNKDISYNKKYDCYEVKLDNQIIHITNENLQMLKALYN